MNPPVTLQLSREDLVDLLTASSYMSHPSTLEAKEALRIAATLRRVAMQGLRQPAQGQPVTIHGTSCELRQVRDEYQVRGGASGELIAAAPTRFLAVARAATVLLGAAR